MKPNLLSDENVIITAAITGGVHGKWTNPNIPISPEEQAEAALKCYEAGATVCHIHVRGEDGQCTPDLKTYNKTVSLIKEKCPIITQIGNGIGTWFEYDTKKTKGGKPYGRKLVMATLEQRLNLLNISPKPDMFTINAGTFEFRLSNIIGGNFFDNPISFNMKYIKKCKEIGVGIEIEVYDLSHISNIMDLIEMGAFKRNEKLHFSLVLGIKGGAPASVENLTNMVDALPEGSTWQVVTVGKYNLRTTVIALCMGGNIRTGMEDNVYYRRSELAQSNAQLVSRMARLSKELGREVATIDEAKKFLELK